MLPSHSRDDPSSPRPSKRAKFSEASIPNNEYKEVSAEGNIDGAENNENSPGGNYHSPLGDNQGGVAADVNSDAEDSSSNEGILFDYNKALALDLERDGGPLPVQGDGESEDEFLERERDYQERVTNQRTLKYIFSQLILINQLTSFRMQRQLESKVCEQLSEETRVPGNQRILEAFAAILWMEYEKKVAFAIISFAYETSC